MIPIVCTPHGRILCVLCAIDNPDTDNEDDIMDEGTPPDISEALAEIDKHGVTFDSRGIVTMLRDAYDEHAKKIRDVPAGSAYDSLRTKYRTRAEQAALTLDSTLAITWPGKCTEHVIAVANRGATLRGFTHTGVTYHNAPDMFVGDYVPGRDDSSASGWMQPRWVDGEMVAGIEGTERVSIAIDPGAPEGDRSTLVMWASSDDGARVRQVFDVIKPATIGTVGIVAPASVEILPPPAVAFDTETHTVQPGEHTPSSLQLAALLAAPFGDPISATELLTEADDLTAQSEQLIRDAAADDFDTLDGEEPAFERAVQVRRDIGQNDEAFLAAVIALGEERAATVYHTAWSDKLGRSDEEHEATA